MLRLGLASFAFAFAACASAPRPIAMTCRPLGHVHVEGAPLSVRIELRNESTAPVEVVGIDVPWQFRHAVRFEAEPDFADPRVLADPGDPPSLRLAPGGSDRGDVDITERLIDPSGRSIARVPGSHRVRATARLTLDAGAPTAREVDVSCAFDLTIQPRESALGRAYEAAVAAASEAGYDVGRFRAMAAERDDAGWTFDFVHVHPAPPGGHFAVRVTRDGRTEVIHGR